jgi:hypothetical protein
MVKDILGNDLKVGDVVTLHPDAAPKMFIAKITHISEGGLAVPTAIQGQKAIQGGTVRLVMDFAIGFNPTAAIAMVKLVTPPETPQA